MTEYIRISMTSRCGASFECDSLFEDCCGIAIQCNNQQALDLYNQGLFEYIKGYGDYVSTFEKALELDANFVLVHCTLVRIYWLKSVLMNEFIVGLYKAVC